MNSLLRARLAVFYSVPSYSISPSHAIPSHPVPYHSHSQAQYSSKEWEAILEDMLGDRAMVDMVSNPDIPKVILCSTIINVTPLEMMLWRNYGYREDQEAVYKVCNGKTCYYCCDGMVLSLDCILWHYGVTTWCIITRRYGSIA